MSVSCAPKNTQLSEKEEDMRVNCLLEVLVVAFGLAFPAFAQEMAMLKPATQR